MVNETIDKMETPAGRKITAVSAAGVSITLESSEQSARGRREAAEAELAEIKLRAVKRGSRFIKLR